MLLQYKHRLQKLKGKPHRKDAARQLLQYTGGRLLKLQRMLKIDFEEECRRCRNTWRDWDFKLWLATCSAVEDLKRHVADPGDFVKNRRALVLGFSDQVPWWGLVGQVKQVYSSSEVQSGMQKRGFDADAAMKFRITVELRQLILEYANPVKSLVGCLGPTLVVFPGVHCRLDNVAEAGRRRSSETFWVGGKKVQREAGGSAGNLMMPWRKLRSARPELFRDVVIMQQPAAVTDAVITCWSI